MGDYFAHLVIQDVVTAASAGELPMGIEGSAVSSTTH